MISLHDFQFGMFKRKVKTKFLESTLERQENSLFHDFSTRILSEYRSHSQKSLYQKDDGDDFEKENNFTFHRHKHVSNFWSVPFNLWMYWYQHIVVE